MTIEQEAYEESIKIAGKGFLRRIGKAELRQQLEASIRQGRALRDIDEQADALPNGSSRSWNGGISERGNRKIGDYRPIRDIGELEREGSRGEDNSHNFDELRQEVLTEVQKRWQTMFRPDRRSNIGVGGARKAGPVFRPMPGH